MGRSTFSAAPINEFICRGFYKINAIVFIFLVLPSCTQTRTSSRDGVDALLDVLITRSYEVPVDFPELYDSLVTTMPADSLERLVLAEKLMARGFTMKDRGRGNFPPLGVRIVQLELTNGECTCVVSKKYLFTPSPDRYQPVESIVCSGKVQASIRD